MTVGYVREPPHELDDTNNRVKNLRNPPPAKSSGRAFTYMDFVFSAQLFSPRTLQNLSNAANPQSMSLGSPLGAGIFHI